MNKMTKNEVSARAALLLAAIIWGTTFAAITSVGTLFPPAFLLFMRCIIGASLLLIIFIKQLKKITLMYFIIAALLGLFMTGAYLVQTIALTTARCPPGRCGFLVATYCVLTPFASWCIEGRKPSIFNIAAALLCLVGVLCISLPDLQKDTHVAMNTGDALGLLSSLIFAIYLVYITRYMKKYDPVLLTILHLFFGGFYSFLYYLLFEQYFSIVWTMNGVIMVLYLGIICMAATNLMQAYGQKYTPASTTALIFSLESVFGIIFTVIFLNETITPMLFLGCSLIFIAILISETQVTFLKKQ